MPVVDFIGISWTIYEVMFCNAKHSLIERILDDIERHARMEEITEEESNVDIVSKEESGAS